MAELRFEWDQRKAAANLAKPGVSFEEAQTAFSDEALSPWRILTQETLRIGSSSSA
jgi:uncharacterized DUF497 family protein